MYAVKSAWWSRITRACAAFVREIKSESSSPMDCMSLPGFRTRAKENLWRIYALRQASILASNAGLHNVSRVLVEMAEEIGHE